MEIKLYDTMTRKVKGIAPTDEKRFRFYCCGLTVYGPAHIGNFRTFTLQDVLRRILKISGLNPYHIRNITDVDDKTIRQSESKGKSLKKITEKWTDIFHADCQELNMLPPHKEPKASEHIPQQIKLISTLLNKGCAYQAKDGSIYFKISTFPDYGKLTQLDRVELKTQTDANDNHQNLADEYEKETVADFSLWKARKANDGNNYWVSPWGEGRPGWHLECSAMSMEYLGESFDLHGGGIDLCFPHHENEIAQSEMATGIKPFSKHWFHSAHLIVDGKKMSKSLGNMYTLEEIKLKGYTAMALRYLLISGHYRQPLNFTFNGIDAAQSAINKLETFIYEMLSNIKMIKEDFISLQLETSTDDWGYLDKAWEALINDLNTPACLGNIFSALNKISSANLTTNEITSNLKALAHITYALGLDPFSKEQKTVLVPNEIRKLAEERWLAKNSKDFIKADKFRDEIQAEGWQVHDGKDTYKLVPL